MGTALEALQLFVSPNHRNTCFGCTQVGNLQDQTSKAKVAVAQWLPGSPQHLQRSYREMSKEFAGAGAETKRVMADQAEEKFEKIRVESEDRRSVKNRDRQDAGGPFGQGRGAVEGNEQGDRRRC